MNNKRGLSVDFLLLPQLIKDATHWVRQRGESMQAIGKVGKGVMGGLRVENRQKGIGKQREERRRRVEREGLFWLFLKN